MNVAQYKATKNAAKAVKKMESYKALSEYELATNPGRKMSMYNAVLVLDMWDPRHMGSRGEKRRYRTPPKHRSTRFNLFAAKLDHLVDCDGEAGETKKETKKENKKSSKPSSSPSSSSSSSSPSPISTPELIRLFTSIPKSNKIQNDLKPTNTSDSIGCHVSRSPQVVAPRLTNSISCPDPILTQHHPRSSTALGESNEALQFESTEEALKKNNQNDGRHEALDDIDNEPPPKPKSNKIQNDLKSTNTSDSMSCHVSRSPQVVAPRLTNPISCPDPILTQHHSRSSTALGESNEALQFESTEEVLERENQNCEKSYSSMSPYERIINQYAERDEEWVTLYNMHYVDTPRVSEAMVVVNGNFTVYLNSVRKFNGKGKAGQGALHQSRAKSINIILNSRGPASVYIARNFVKHLASMQGICDHIRIWAQIDIAQVDLYMAMENMQESLMCDVPFAIGDMRGVTFIRSDGTTEGKTIAWVQNNGFSMIDGDPGVWSGAWHVSREGTEEEQRLKRERLKREQEEREVQAAGSLGEEVLERENQNIEDLRQSVEKEREESSLERLLDQMKRDGRFDAMVEQEKQRLKRERLKREEGEEKQEDQQVRKATQEEQIIINRKKWELEERARLDSDSDSDSSEEGCTDAMMYTMEHMMNHGKDDYGLLVNTCRELDEGRDEEEAKIWKSMSQTEEAKKSKVNKNEVQEEKFTPTEEKYEEYSHESKGKTYQELNRDERRKFEDEMMQRIAVDKQALWNLRGGEGQVRRTNQRRKKKNNKKKAAARTAEHKNQNPNTFDDHQFVDGH